VTVTKSPQKDKSACLTMQILNKEAVEKVRSEREIPDVQPGCMIQMRLVYHFFVFLLQRCSDMVLALIFL